MTEKWDYIFLLKVIYSRTSVISSVDLAEATLEIEIEDHKIELSVATTVHLQNKTDIDKNGVLYVTLNDYFTEELIFVVNFSIIQENCSVKMLLAFQDNQNVNKTHFDIYLDLLPNSQKTINLGGGGSSKLIAQ
ncbi:hypothetical protein RF11_11495 [Thelohanellus kitauei]|uniref:Uncharacterized protein n=1 Tax=Thelohanellus kitauei TaxID=669202 RepID=A0A0C2MQW9_THEKT|nr:hypothetical protein RF11_11495 [Thelohanellus kitauei]